MADLKRYNAEHFDEMESSVTVFRSIGMFSEYLRGRVLDIGCGKGRLQAHVDGEYYGVDISERCGGYVKNFTCVDASREPLPFRDGFFDAVAVFSVLEHVENFIFLMEEVRRVLRKGGAALVVVPNPRNIMYNGIVLRKFALAQKEQSPHIHSFTEEDLRNLFFIVGMRAVRIERVGNRILGRRLPEMRPFNLFAEDIMAVAVKD